MQERGLKELAQHQTRLQNGKKDASEWRKALPLAYQIGDREITKNG